MHCDEVIDLFDERLDRLPIPDTTEHGFQVTGLRVQLRGTCRRCREKEEQG
jgi:Fe2+ or Zn2+ uptake regulation protein